MRWRRAAECSRAGLPAERRRGLLEADREDNHGGDGVVSVAIPASGHYLQ
jgi:hypothetical protein